MSIFDKNIHHPVETLYDQCKEIVEWIVPMNMMHYNGSCEQMEQDIITMLKERGLWVGGRNGMAYKDDINKINQVGVSMGGYTGRGIPTYIVYFYYVTEIRSSLWLGGSAIQYGAYLTKFTVGINGIINEPVQQ